MINIIKKDGALEQYNKVKIINACRKSAERALDDLSYSSMTLHQTPDS